MREYRLAVAVAAVALGLGLLGSLIEPQGTMLACPDWPLCNGSALPPVQGPALIEQGHRIVALALAVLTGTLAALVLRTRTEGDIRRLAIGAVLLVGVQAAIGAISVVYGLPSLARAGHLGAAMLFFAVMVHLAMRLRPASRGSAPAPQVHP